MDPWDVTFSGSDTYGIGKTIFLIKLEAVTLWIFVNSKILDAIPAG